MNKVKFSLVTLAAQGLFGCATAQSPVTGFVYTELQAPLTATEAPANSARGEACVTSILGAVATGDASIDAAKKAGGITQVAAVDHTSKSVLGFYAEYCTIVRGKK